MAEHPIGPAGATDEDLSDLYENAPCGYLSLLPGGVVARSNQTFLAWTGYRRDEVIGRRFQDLLHIAGKIYYETHFAPLLRMQGQFDEVALEIVCRDGSRLPVLVNARERQVDGSTRFTRLTIFNSTDRRRYERELLAARQSAQEANAKLQELNDTLEQRISKALEEQARIEEALRQSQKMEAIGQLTGGVAHDFNNLLTVIIGGLETIGRQLDRLPEDPQVARMRRARNMAEQGAKRAATLTARLLAFSRRQPLDPKPLDSNHLVAGMAELLQRTLGETIALETVAGAGLWRALADASELENVLINLAVNARDAMPGGGKLTIETGNASLEEAYVTALAEPVPPGQYVLIAVSDTGFGMSPETLDRVFEPFFTTKEVGRGTGLGLSQVYGFVRQSGGHIRIDSEPGEGTTVKLYLPRYVGPDSSVAAQSAPASSSASAGGNETILVVEDHDNLRSYSSGVLRELGYTVLEAHNGRAALDLLQSHHNVDLLFTDVVLPDGMHGRELADEAARRRPGIKVLYTTGYTRNAIVHGNRLAPGVALIGKPFGFAELAAKVRAILDH